MFTSRSRFSTSDGDNLIRTPFQPCNINQTLLALCQNHEMTKLCHTPNADYELVSDLFYCWVTTTEDCLMDANKHIFKFSILIKYMFSTYEKTFECSYDEIKSAHNIYKHLLPDHPIEQPSEKTQQWRNALLAQNVEASLTNLQISSPHCAQHLRNDRLSVMGFMNQTLVNVFGIEYSYMCVEAVELVSLYLYGSKCDQITNYISTNIEKEQQKIDLFNKYAITRDKLEASIDYSVNAYENEEIKSHECTSPNTSFFGTNTKATVNDARVLSIILNGLFNSPTVALNDNFFAEFPLQFSDKMQSLLQTFAYTLRAALRTQSTQQRLRGTQLKRLYTEFDTVEFHRAYAVRKGNGFHWELKFEGFDKLLSLDWFDTSRVHAQILDNNAVGQRLFWYSEPELHSQAEFNKMWTYFYKRNLDQPITAKQIGYLVEIWTEQFKTPKYNPMKNNCQHFVRDMISFIDINTAKEMTAKLQRTTISRILFVANVIKQEEQQRVTQINWVLKLYMFLANNDMTQYYDKLKDYDIEQLISLSEQKMKEIFSEKHKNVYKSRINTLI